MERPKEQPMCNLSPANYRRVTHFLLFNFVSYVIAHLQKDLEQISLQWLSQFQKSWKQNLSGKTAFPLCTQLNRSKYGCGLFKASHQG